MAEATKVITREELLSSIDKCLPKTLFPASEEDIAGAITYDSPTIAKWDRRFCSYRNFSFLKDGVEDTKYRGLIYGMRSDCCGSAKNFHTTPGRNNGLHSLLIMHTPIAWVKGTPGNVEKEIILPYLEWVNKIGFPLNYHGVFNVNVSETYGFFGSTGFDDKTRTKHALCPSYVYSIYQDDLLSQSHSLATFTFYRYLQHPAYNKIPVLWLKLLEELSVRDDDLNPVECLAIAHLAGKAQYEPRTACLSTTSSWIHCLGLTENIVKDGFKKNTLINSVFYNSKDGFYSGLEKNETTITGNQFKSGLRATHLQGIITQLNDNFKIYIKEENFEAIARAVRRLKNFLDTPLDKLPNKLTVNEFICD